MPDHAISREVLLGLRALSRVPDLNERAEGLETRDGSAS